LIYIAHGAWRPPWAVWAVEIGDAASLQFFRFKCNLLRQHNIADWKIAFRDDTETLDDTTIVV
jgi:hypothetical protein